MKNILCFLVLMAIVGCAEQELYKNTVDIVKNENHIDQYAYLMEQARWGNGQAYLKLADYYRTGQGGKKDFLGTISMFAMADQYSEVNKMEDYLKALPEKDNMKLFFDAMDSFDKKNMEEFAEITDRLIAEGLPEGYSLKGVMAVEMGETIEGKRLIEMAVEQGSTFAELLLAIISGKSNGKRPSIEVLAPLADRIPLACKLLGDAYAGIENDSVKNEELAAVYYQKADEQACLGKRAARWLVNYYERNGIQVDKREMERLKKLSGEK